jgi:RNA polymerase sigma-70 factor, ECF subfamily
MPSGSRDGISPLVLVGKDSAAREPEWSDLMAAAQDGDSAAYRRLLEEVTPYIRSLARRRHRDAGDVEEAVQDVLLTVHAIRHTYDPKRPFGPWLVAIAKRRIVDRLRRESRRRARETTLEAARETFAMPAANLSEETMDARALRAAVERLPPGQRQAIKLLKLQELSLSEAAVASGMSVSALKAATHRAVRSLRRLLGTGDGDP